MSAKKILQKQVKQALKRGNSSSEEEDSLVVLKRKLLKTQEDLEEFKRTAAHGTDAPSRSKHLQQRYLPLNENCDQEEQLYGEHYDEKMVCIGDEIYCRKIVYDMALGTSHKATHMARKLLDGVFRKELLLNATLTGQSPRAQSRDRQMENVIPLCYRARSAIIEFSLKIAGERGWETQCVKDLERAVSQRLGEIKRQNKQ